MRVLLIDTAARERIKKVKEFANCRRHNFHDIARRMRNNLPPPGDDENYRAEFFDGFKVVYTIEEQPEPLGWVRHISVSVVPKGNKQAMPNEMAVAEILKEFGLPSLAESVNLYVEHIEDAPSAINLLFPFKE